MPCTLAWSSRAARLLSSRVTLYSRPGNDRFSLVVEAYLIELFHHACRMGLEGIVSKRKDSTYRSGRSRRRARQYGGREDWGR